MSDQDMGYDAAQEVSQEAWKRRQHDVVALARELYEADPLSVNWPPWNDLRSGTRAVWLEKARTKLIPEDS